MTGLWIALLCVALYVDGALLVTHLVNRAFPISKGGPR